MSRALRLALEAQALFQAADAQNRPLTADERVYCEELLAEAEQTGAAEKRLADIGRQLGPAGGELVTLNDPNGWAGRTGGVGDAFIASKGYRDISDPGRRPQSWSTGAIEVPPFAFQAKAYRSASYSTKGTLLEGTAGSGMGLVPVPQVLGGVVETVFEPLSVAAVFAQSQTTTNSIRYIVEGTATSGAAGVAEAGVKPQSVLGLSTTDEPVKKIATTIVVSDELLDDVTSAQAYLNGRLSLFVQREEEGQLLRGAGTNELYGLLDASRAINTVGKSATDDNTVAVARVIASIRGSSWLEADTILMHPDNWLTTRLLRDGTGGTAGQYFGGGPFSYGPYGNGGVVGQFGGQLWGKPVILTTTVGTGTCVVGAFGQAAQIVRRGGPTVEATNSGYVSGVDLFTSDQVAIRSESRLALCVFRPAAFCAISGMS